MVHCGRCGKAWPDDHVSCPEDGTPLGGPVPSGVSQPGAYPAAAVAMPAGTEFEELGPGALVGGFQVVSKVGEGGMGAVYGATHPVIGKKAAIKVISPQLGTNREAVERFVQEARAVNRIGHPNIVDVFDFGLLPDGRPYFVMEWLQGESLDARLRRGRLPLAEALDILDDVCRALGAAHENGIVHRDLKPGNIFLSAVRGERALVKLLDFGMAKLAAAHDERVERTRSGIMLGTPLYMSPEQAFGRNVDHRTDIYALGVISYELILGALPFYTENPLEVITHHLYSPPPTPRSLWPDVPPALDGLLLAMLEKDAARRPTLLDIRRVIAEHRAGVALPAGAVSPWPPPPSPFSPPTPYPGAAGAPVPTAPGRYPAPTTPGLYPAPTTPGPYPAPTTPGLYPGAAAPTPAPMPGPGQPPSSPGMPLGAPYATQPAAPAPSGGGRKVVLAVLITAVLAAGAVAAFVALSGSPARTTPSAGPTGPNGAAVAASADAASLVAVAADAAPAAGPIAVTTADAAPASTAPPPSSGALVVESSVRGDVSLDGQIVARGVLRAEVPASAGPHVVEVAAPGRAPWRQEVKVEPGATLVVKARPARRGGSGPSDDDGVMRDPFASPRR